MMTLEIQKRVQDVLTEVRPFILSDGGDVELVNLDLQSGQVALRLTGACVGCPMSQFTLTMGLEAAIKSAVPEIKTVILVD